MLLPLMPGFFDGPAQPAACPGTGHAASVSRACRCSLEGKVPRHLRSHGRMRSRRGHETRARR